MAVFDLSAANLIEFDPRDDLVFDACRRAGSDRYLAVVPNAQRAEALALAFPALRDRIAVARGREPVKQNNADCVVLSGSAVFKLWFFGLYRHAEFVAWRPAAWWQTCIAAIPAFFLVRSGRLSRALSKTLDETKPSLGATMRVAAVRRRRKRKHVRHFIPHALGVKRFFSHLEQWRARHVVIRGADFLPESDPNEKLCVLVEADFIEKVRDLASSGPGLRPLYVYGSTRVPGAFIKGMPYYPPHLADLMIDSAVRQGDFCRVACPEHRFLSLAFHLVYHQGARSGLSADDDAARSFRSARKSYRCQLQRRAKELEIKVETTLVGLDAMLRDKGWRPPPDSMSHLSKYHSWIKPVLRKELSAGKAQLAAFLLREMAVELEAEEMTIQQLQEAGFEILMTKLLTDDERHEASVRTRGGDWDQQKPKEVSGGLPAMIVMALDPEPQRPAEEQSASKANITNDRVLVKHRIREDFNRKFGLPDSCRSMHAADNPLEAWHYAEVLLPEKLDEIRARMDEVESAFNDDTALSAS